MSDFNGRARSILAPKESLRPQVRPEQAQNALTPTESIRPQARPEQAQGPQTVVDKERDDLFTLFTEMLGEYRKLSANPTVQPVSENPDRQFYESTLSETDRFGGVSQATDAQTAVPAPPPVTTQELAPAGAETTATTTTKPDSTTFATITKNGTSTTVNQTVPLTQGFDTLTQSEGTNIHLDGRGFLTLPHGIVPDANSVKKADGTPFDPTGSHGIKAGGLSGVDYSEATKFGISRKDYSDDEAFAKAVYAEFGDRTSSKYGQGFDQLSDAAKQAAYDIAWNAGVGSASWSSVKTMLTEASKEDDNTKVTDNLIGFTTNFKSGSDYPRGLLKRRVQTYNLVAKEGEEASTITTSSVTENGKRTGTKYEIKKSDGSVLKTWTKPDLNEKLGDLEVG